ncbi:cell division protein ZapE [Nesterenkonia sp. E16_7]|uniref:cell division protein ZapE n=1 Tax=unclassified Nesterenkonia TaxID=2629769 RepID=UPI001A929C08|nr:MULTISPECIES: cell division protein ZapE [unclassified Nesterenkonia]MBO0596019.1 cell division protein ZapE [Nesterenkonia sp. E16_10]MBO0599381.1 cell division protein ZapE [Nesterenkonia sp. E16_7]
MPSNATPLSQRTPQLGVGQLLEGLRPSFRFAEVSFDSYIPDPAHPSQEKAVTALREFSASVGASQGGGGFLGKLFGRAPARPKVPAGIYLDGGFGVGKTHLLASLYHSVEGQRAFGTFVEYTNLVGALSFRRTVDVLSDYALVCIDEFELDDPGDTVLMSRLMRELADAGVKLAATSNTIPGSLGEGRFAAADFQREIQVLSDQFTVIKVDGEDYRHRGLPEAPAPLGSEEIEDFATRQYPEARIAVDDFDALCNHITGVHPSRYRQLVTDMDVLVLKDVETIEAQALALRFVVLADRLYDQDIKIVASGKPFDQLFTEEMMAGGYMKKYHRTVSRLTALARAGQMGEVAL